MKALVTGASGFLGHHIASDLARRGIEVLAVSRSETVFEPGIARLRVSRYRSLPSADVLLHFADESAISVANDAGHSYVSDAVGRLSEIVDSGAYGLVLYASSAAVYGDESRQSRRVGEKLEPSTAYAAAKLACEQAVREVQGLALRLGNVIGPGMSPSSVVSDILRQIPGSGPIRVRDETPVRDYLWIDDLCDCIAAFLHKRVRGTFNVSSGIGLSVGQLAQAALRIAGEHDRQVLSTSASSRSSQLVLDISDTIAASGWRPTTSIESALSRILESRHE